MEHESSNAIRTTCSFSSRWPPRCCARATKPVRSALSNYARRLEQLIQANYRNDKFLPGGGPSVAKRKDEFDRSQARVRILEARAQGLLDRKEEAIRLAEASYTIFPSVEGAREAARWLAAAGKDREALGYFAQAFTIAGLRSADQDGAKDREKMGELYRKLNGSENGLGDMILKAYDETSQLLAGRRAELRLLDPNHLVSRPRAVYSFQSGWRQADAVLARRQSRGARLLGYLVRSLPRSARALRRGESQIQRRAGRGLPLRRYRRGPCAGPAVLGIA